MTFAELLGINKMALLAIDTTNFCNIHCESCLKMSNIPINPNNDNVFRRKVKLIDIDDVVLFCERFKGIGESDQHQMSGGEPTSLPSELFNQIVYTLNSYNRNINLTTNGFALLDIKQNVLNKIHTIVLDDHGINSEHIRNCESYLSTFFKGTVRTLHNYEHFDTSEIMRGRQGTNGRKCGMWLTQPSISGKIIYPCCLLNCIKFANNSHKIADELEASGWTIDNKDVVETIKNHTTTLPKYVIDQCENNCWHPGPPPKIKITSKPNDIIKRG